ncbi:hypothetical protein COV15_00225 [Candidatus Woesearchaeota archaeon CG10_big_fil_rev_8_21_14_0_10_34_12]|nr:MAG: hypothetical protein COV15_00225 [Candidatus Woesearchaeota archaeon CG10_big_fil_rev_8_21_14_0_10_34_12]
MRSITNKRAALELSIGTMVIIILAITMLILGLALVRNIFKSSMYNVDQMSNKIEEELNKLFSEGKKIAIYGANNIFEPKQGDSWGVAFGVKSFETGIDAATKFSYIVSVASSDEEIKQNCGSEWSKAKAISWIVAGKTSDFTLPVGDSYKSIIRFKIPENAPLCIVRYNIDVAKTIGSSNSPTPYTSDFFDLDIQAK